MAIKVNNSIYINIMVHLQIQSCDLNLAYQLNEIDNWKSRFRYLVGGHDQFFVTFGKNEFNSIIFSRQILLLQSKFKLNSASLLDQRMINTSQKISKLEHKK